MINKHQVFLLILTIVSLTFQSYAQDENDIAGFEISIDQDFLADMLRDEPLANRNYTVGLRLGFYGVNANHIYLGLPYVRQKLDGWIIDGFIENLGIREENLSHNFAFVINGFSPSHISDETDLFAEQSALGYRLQDDRPFSSFTGFRSTRRIEGYKQYAHSGKRIDYGITSSFTFGFMSLGLAQGLENYLGSSRPNANLWDRDKTKPYPTGQTNHGGIPMFMYSLSIERVLWRPIKKVLLQARPEINVGYYTNIGIGFDFGKVMNSNRLIDNLSYTDTNNPSLLSVNTEDISLSLVGGATVRAVFYNAHLNGLYGWNPDHYYGFGEMKKWYIEGYVGAKLQLFRKLEFTFSLNRRSAEFSDNIERHPIWGTLGFKYLMASPGKGCYNL